MKERRRKYMENIEIERSFFLYYADDQLHAADLRSELSCSTRGKGSQKLTTEKRKRNFLQKSLAYSSKIFLEKSMQPLRKAITFYVLLKYLMWITLTHNKAIQLISLNEALESLPTFMEQNRWMNFKGKESKVDAIIDKEEIMKELSNFLLNSKDVSQCYNEKKDQSSAELKVKLTKEKSAE